MGLEKDQIYIYLIKSFHRFLTSYLTLNPNKG
jgi:hypothetical protein